MPAESSFIHYDVCLGAAGGKECEVIMKEIKLIIKEEEFKEITVEVGQVSWEVRNDRLQIFGSVTYDKKGGEKWMDMV